MEGERFRVFAPFLLVDGVLVFVMVLLLRLDWIVNDVLYGYGLVFSLGWALPYWAVLRVCFVLLVFGVGVVSVVGFGVCRRVRREGERVVFVCRSCGRAWVEVDRIVKVRGRLPGFRVLSSCGLCDGELLVEEAVAVGGDELKARVRG